MKQIKSLAVLRGQLANPRFLSGLKYDEYEICSYRKPLAWLLPPQDTSAYEQVQSIAITRLKTEAGFYIDLLKQATLSQRFSKPVAIGLLGGGSELLCVLVVDSTIVQSKTNE